MLNVVATKKATDNENQQLGNLRGSGRSHFLFRFSSQIRIHKQKQDDRMGGIGKLLKKIDMNPSTEDSFLVRTTSGAVSRLFCIV